jgi:hypothetical protein
MSCCGQKRQMIVRSQFAPPIPGVSPSGSGERDLRSGRGPVLRTGSAVRSLLARRAYATRRRH